MLPISTKTIDAILSMQWAVNGAPFDDESRESLLSRLNLARKVFKRIMRGIDRDQKVADSRKSAKILKRYARKADRR